MHNTPTTPITYCRALAWALLLIAAFALSGCRTHILLHRFPTPPLVRPIHLHR